MGAFLTHSGSIAVYNADHVDTDRIIPARFLSMISRSGYGELLFNDVRQNDFPLDQPAARNASVLVVGSNFGCGSSREHAVWALQQAGFKAIIARREGESPGYSDIFRSNAANCGLLLIELDGPAQASLVESGSGTTITIDLPNQTVSQGSNVYSFEINATMKDALIRGLDLIGTTLEYADAIQKYESTSTAYTPK